MSARALANLRHAYQQLHEGVVRDQRQFANKLLSPAIAELERSALQDEALLRQALEALLEQHPMDISYLQHEAIVALRERLGVDHE
jgi:hypothetical protein